MEIESHTVDSNGKTKHNENVMRWKNRTYNCVFSCFLEFFGCSSRSSLLVSSRRIHSSRCSQFHMCETKWILYLWLSGYSNRMYAVVVFDFVVVVVVIRRLNVLHEILDNLTVACCAFYKWHRRQHHDLTHHAHRLRTFKSTPKIDYVQRFSMHIHAHSNEYAQFPNAYLVFGVMCEFVHVTECVSYLNA